MVSLEVNAQVLLSVNVYDIWALMSYFFQQTPAAAEVQLYASLFSLDRCVGL